MGRRPSILNSRLLVIILPILGLISLTACAQGAASQDLIASQGQKPALTGVSSTEQAPDPTPTPTLTPFEPEPFTPAPTVSLTRRPTPSPTPVPPARFETDALNRGVLPVSYIQDECLYLEARWNPDNATPGTVVVPVMFHGISKAGPRGKDNITVSTAYFEASVVKARQLGFETITMQQLVDFLHHNAYIPPRSLLLIIDDRRLGTVREHFMPVLKKYDWTLTMAYITGVINEQEWNQVRDVLARGHTEVQAHGYLHNGETYITEWTSEEIIRNELFAPIPAIEEHLGYRPIAFIWPGGDFNLLSVQIAREAEYQVGFTAFARGPLLFNWVPQGELEREIGDPLLTLPRYWSTTMFKNLDYAVEMGASAAAQAEKQRVDEINWYRSNCSDYPPLSIPIQAEEEVTDRW
ncbi:MAG TPA: hypothetical protein DCP32_08215 [Anaerolineaceae bacterium]|nr:hypothetical protein [Anaerolineaceae bacterium]HBA90327.1 hypothetical protein [Anaerolineaceae bacterium]